jgi:DNA (cytosine-5)-methyltransferase 1
MARPLLLDLFCGAGGAAMGYHRAGFDVVGVDIVDQPDYPFRFIQADALDLLRGVPCFIAPRTLSLEDVAEITELLRPENYDAIHASPPCIRWTALPLTIEQRERHPDLITPLRPLLTATGLPYVIENVPRAPLIGPALICGAAMGLKVIVHRNFEANWPLMSYGCACPKDATTRRGFVNRRPRGPLVSGRKSPRRGESHWREAAGLDHLTGQAARNAIPPAYTEYIGRQLLDHLAVTA